MGIRIGKWGKAAILAGVVSSLLLSGCVGRKEDW